LINKIAVYSAWLLIGWVIENQVNRLA